MLPGRTFLSFYKSYLWWTNEIEFYFSFSIVWVYFYDFALVCFVNEIFYLLSFNLSYVYYILFICYIYFCMHFV